MKLATVSTMEELFGLVSDDLGLAIVEGYDGVGKGRIIRELVYNFGWKVYRPDYRYWNNHLDTKKRWLIMRAFMDLMKITKMEDTILLDRAMMSGAVYAEDVSIAHEMSARIKDLDMDVLHILVTTDKDSYYKMQGVQLGEEIPRMPYSLCEKFTDRYRRYMDEAGIKYVEFNNSFNVKVGNKSMGRCGGCDSWNLLRQEYDSQKMVGHCAHWDREMPEDGDRCAYYGRRDEHAR